MYVYSVTVQGILAHGLRSLKQMVFWSNPTVVIELPLLQSVIVLLFFNTLLKTPWP
jgi:hypothetical protein